MATAAAIGANAPLLAVLRNATEAVSNGVWLQVLQNYFPPNRFIIAPEDNQAAGRADLTVYMYIDNNNQPCWQSIFVLEGKTPGDNILLHMAQVSGYVHALNNPAALGKNRFGMLVAGEAVVLLVNFEGGNNSTQWYQANCDFNHYDLPIGLTTRLMQDTAANGVNIVDGFLAGLAGRL